jgi:hypothetical protein
VNSVHRDAALEVVQSRPSPDATCRPQQVVLAGTSLFVAGAVQPLMGP